jgi:hypothetical protein
MHVQVSYDWFNLSKFIKSNLSLHIIYKTFCFRFCIIGSVWHAILFHFPCFIVQLPSVLRIYLCLLANKEMWFYLISFYNSRPAWMEDVWKFMYAINVNECMFGFIVPRDFKIILFSNSCSILMKCLPTEASTYVVFCDYFKIFFGSTDFKCSWFKHKLKLFVFKCTIIVLYF